MPTRGTASNRQPAVNRLPAVGRLSASNRQNVSGGGGGGGGADMIVTASLPAPGAADTTSLYRLTVDNNLYFTDGVTWFSQQGVAPAATAPVVANFSAFNSGSFSQVNGGVFLTIPASATTAFKGAVLGTPPSVPYIITAQVIPISYPANFVHIGLFFTDGTKIQVFGFGYNGQTRLLSTTFTNATNINDDYANVITQYGGNGPITLRIADNNTSRICSYSVDGSDFIVFDTQSRTNFLTATNVGFGGNAQNNVAAGILLKSWIQT